MEEDAVEANQGTEVAGFENFSQFIAEGYKVVMGGVKSSMALPSGRNYQFYQTYTNFRDKMAEKQDQIQSMMEQVLSSEGVKGQVRDVTIEDAMDSVVSVNDKLLDRASRFMDLMEGIKTGIGELVKEADISGSWNKPTQKKPNNFTLNIQRNVPRPQFTFKDKVDNSNRVWEPRIRDKPNALKPLAILLETNDDGDECFSHPYEFELEMFNVPEKQLVKVKPDKPLLLEQTPYQFIDKEEDLDHLLLHLQKQDQFAVDLEHHSYRSFLGFTCLVQISTKDRDVLLDALALRHCLHNLNKVTTDPNILKVFHGADSDIVWLQRDFGVYVVNMFDTHQAGKLLNLPRLSLAYLLNVYCNIDPNKHFQLFDWRTRPIPEEAVKYAREDTHYLLFIAGVMRNQLIDRANGQTNILKAVYHQSKLVCLKRFEKLVVDEESYLSVYRKGKRFFDNRQLYALKALYLWRDKTARELDESLAYVLPDNMMLNIAENLPREVQGILACCNPVPPLVKANLLEMHYLIVKAKEQPLVKEITESQAQVSIGKTSDVSAEQQQLEAWCYPASDVRHDLPTLLGNDTQESNNTLHHDTSELSIESRPQLGLFDSKGSWYNLSEEEGSGVDQQVLNKLRGLNFVSPYQRYVRVLPYSAQLEKERKEMEMQEAEEHRARSKQQQALAMEIKTLEESGLIKLKKEEEVKETLKMELANERKRKAEEKGSSKHARKLARYKKNLQPVSDQPADTSEHPADASDSPQKELREVKAEQDSESRVKFEANSKVKTDSKPLEWNKPASWKQLRQQKQSSENLESFDYSQVNYQDKFSSGTASRGGKSGGKAGGKNNHQVLDKKKKWISNVGAKKFNSKKKKRARVV